MDLTECDPGFGRGGVQPDRDQHERQAKIAGPEGRHGRELTLQVESESGGARSPRKMNKMRPPA